MIIILFKADIWSLKIPQFEDLFINFITQYSSKELYAM